MTNENNWISVCTTQDLVPDSGICALVEETQIALFYLQGRHQVYAVANHDPIAKANVLSRGLIASKGDAIYVASPLYKQHFCLQTGSCLEDDAISIPAWPARINNNQIEVLFQTCS